MKPMVDTAQYRDAVKQAFKKIGQTPLEKEFSVDQGVLAVPLDDREIMNEGVYPPYTVKHWAGWVYQKRPNGKWDKLTRVSDKSKKDAEEQDA